jgi:hypothetical protein
MTGKSGMSQLSRKIRPPKATMTATGNRAEKSYNMTEYKDTSFSIKAERSTDSVSSKGQEEF